MKKIIFLFFTVFATTEFIFSQESVYFNKSVNNEHTSDPRTDKFNFVPNEIIVKFKDNMNLNGETQLKSTGINSIDKVLKSAGIEQLEKLFPQAKRLKSAKVVKDPLGRDMVIPSLHNIYKIVLPELKSTNSPPADIFRFIDELEALPEVEYAEPNYIYSIDNLQSAGPELTAVDLERMQQNNNLKNTSAAVVPNDPLYSEQWYIPAIKADLVWEQTTGDSSQVIAILDTGVDTEHPDLKNKIWRNPDEIPGNSKDDDGNGLVDDYMGWDYINNDNNPMDDNSHGTHVAGIAAAEANNGIGIAGVNWKAKIMPVKVFQSSGYGDAASIAQGISYAAENGATVLNMSFGSYARSEVMEDALTNAYLSVILVAAAGNDGKSIYDTDILGRPLTHHPACLSFVLGVQADGGYSNYDPDGPVFSEIDENFNYEIKAPGSALSTVLNGNYKVMQGTSMATPMIAGALAMYLSHYPDNTLEELWSHFIHSSTGIFNMQEALFSTNTDAILDLVQFELIDNNAGGDNDGNADAGEIVDLIVQIRNTGYPAEDVFVKIQQSNDGDPNDLTILQDSVYLGSIGTYRSLKNEENPLKIKINEDCFHNRTVSVEVKMGTITKDTIFSQKINFKIFNGEELSGIITSDTTFTAGKNWVITNSLRISQGVTLTVEPGASVEVLKGVDNRGKVLAIGEPENRIAIKGYIGGDATYKYIDFDLNGNEINAPEIVFENCNITNLAGWLYAKRLSYCRVENLYLGDHGSRIECDTIYRSYLYNVILDHTFRANIFESVVHDFTIMRENTNINNSKYNVFSKLINVYVYFYPNDLHYAERYRAFLFEIDANQNNHILKNTFLENSLHSYYIKTEGQDDLILLKDQYWGTDNNDKIKPKYFDFYNDASIPYLEINPKLLSPSDSCHAHVWKVLVNGKDAQDENVEPLGVGKHQFDIYFNRPMKKEVIPQVTFGGMYPYTSISINEDGEWSEDGKIYTVYKTIKLTNADGLNRIRVAGAIQDADWGWEIPLEDQRFEFLISAASSASNEFMASPGLGKVDLEWNNNDLEDDLGYNMYRMEQINDSTLSQPVMINSMLITDTLYTDYAVTPNKKYFYYYKILRTNLEETDSSKMVAAIPFTADLGDANGDLNVNVSDIVTVVNYIMENNPQPFIYEAADINGDNIINVLDIVGLVNIILAPESQSLKGLIAEEAQISIEDGIVYVTSPVKIAGIQFTLADINSEQEVEILEALSGFEVVRVMNEGKLTVLAYSLSGKTIEEGKSALLKLNNRDSWIFDAVLSNQTGSSISWSFTGEITAITQLKINSGFTLRQNYPNPFTGTTTIPFELEMNVEEAIISVYDIMGREIKSWQMKNLNRGSHQVEWQEKGRPGVYLYRMYIKQNGQHSYTKAKRMVIY
jgi:subtilisin family serine protease